MLKEEEIPRKNHPNRLLVFFLVKCVSIHQRNGSQKSRLLKEVGRQARTRIGYFCKSGDGRGDVAMGTMLLAGGFYSNRTGVV